MNRRPATSVLALFMSLRYTVRGGRRRRRAASLTWLTQITLMLLEVLSYFMERPATRLFFIQIAASRLINDASRSFAAVLTRFVAGNSEEASGFSFPS